MSQRKGTQQQTFHHVLLHDIAQLFHMVLGKVLAILGRFQPFIRTSIALQLCRSRRGDPFLCHGAMSMLRCFDEWLDD
jgi:hypothetical protein